MRGQGVRVPVILASCLLVSSVFAQPAGGGGGGGGVANAIERYWPLHDIEYGAYLGGYNTDQRPIKDEGWNLSGNKVEFSIGVGARRKALLPGEPPPPPYPTGIDAWITDVVISIGDVQVKNLPGPYEMDVPFVVDAPATMWRIATTKWQDGQPIPVTVSATFHVIFDNGDFTSSLEELDYVHAFTFSAYNKMLHLGTTVDESGNTV